MEKILRWSADAGGSFENDTLLGCFVGASSPAAGAVSAVAAGGGTSPSFCWFFLRDGSPVVLIAVQGFFLFIAKCNAAVTAVHMGSPSSSGASFAGSAPRTQEQRGIHPESGYLFSIWS